MALTTKLRSSVAASSFLDDAASWDSVGEVIGDVFSVSEFEVPSFFTRLLCSWRSPLLKSFDEPFEAASVPNVGDLTVFPSDNPVEIWWVSPAMEGVEAGPKKSGVVACDLAAAW